MIDQFDMIILTGNKKSTQIHLPTFVLKGNNIKVRLSVVTLFYMNILLQNLGLKI